MRRMFTVATSGSQRFMTRSHLFQTHPSVHKVLTEGMAQTVAAQVINVTSVLFQNILNATPSHLPPLPKGDSHIIPAVSVILRRRKKIIFKIQ